MKDEIKEILNKMKDEKRYQAYLLLDYITNLQEENEMYSQLKDEYEDIIEKAIEYIEHENFKRNILVGVSTKKYTKDILNNVLNILQGVGKDE